MAPTSSSRLTNKPTSIDVSAIPLTQQATLGRDGGAARTSTLDADFTENNSSAASTAYPRVDGGKEAWLFLAGAFTIEMLVWYVFEQSQSSTVPLYAP